MKHRRHHLELCVWSATLFEELAVEAGRLDRSQSWVMQRAWEIARAQIRAMPAPARR